VLEAGMAVGIGTDATNTFDEQALWREADAAATSLRQRAAGGLAASRPLRDAIASFCFGFRGFPIDEQAGSRVVPQA
jgi:cytosine/adenosine deaminase-related metal-dependent hydrolase